ncbi:MAG: ATP phosphoribosyltransferase regulatory subunit [Cyanobacteriota bacterium]|nr:ATP phosphoribosyltransferase regulatory subunit [Cyanobacteriota bacterium]
MTVYQPPTGARDLLPVDVAQKRWIEKRLQRIFERWGYHRIITSTLERLDTLMAGGAVRRSTTIQFQDAEDEVLGLRPELTASIARAVVTRMAGTTFPQRLYYNANVFRRSQESGHGQQHEFYQAGVELLGAGGIAADAEILLLLADCVSGLGLGETSIVMGEAGLTRSLLSPFPESLREPVRAAIAHLDRVAIETLPMSDTLRDRALFLFDLRGRPADVLQRLSPVELDPTARQTLENLKSLVEAIATYETLLHQQTPSGKPHPPSMLDSWVLDLSLIQTFDYYTGIVFKVVGDRSSGAQILGQGGRYDRLLGLYHPQKEAYPGIGFSWNIEELQRSLKSTGQLPDRTPACHWLVVPKTANARAAAFAYAQKLRESTHLVRVEVELELRETPASVRDYARDRRIGQIAWIDADGIPEIQTLPQTVE